MIHPSETSLAARLKYFMWPLDERYEDLKANPALKVFGDFTAGLIVAMIAIPLAMGFAMASGLRPEQGIVGGAIAGAVGALFGGSKYQVYGPTAAFIPVIGAIMAKHGYEFLVLASIISGVILMIMGLMRLGRYAAYVPHSIIVGFTIGIATVIATSQLGEVFGIKASMGYGALDKIRGAWTHRGEINGYAVVLALGVFAATKLLLKASKYIPAPLIGLALGAGVSMTVWKDKGLVLVKDKYGAIPTDFWVFSTPAAIQWNAEFLGSLAYFVTAIVFVSGVESLLCSRMADRLAGNKGTPFHPNKEFWGQGMVQIIVPLLNGFPHTGALARTAANIRLGAGSPLAGIFKCVLKLMMAAYMATFLEKVPMACIGGILLYVASGMVKGEEVKEALTHGKFHVGLMVYTAVMVVATDFLTGVATAILLWGVGEQVLKRMGAKKDVSDAPRLEKEPA